MTPHHESGRVSEPDGALKSGLRYLLCMGRLHMLHKSVDVSLRDAKVLVRSQLEAPPDVSHNELSQLQRLSEEAWLSAHLASQLDELPGNQSAVQTAVETKRGHGFHHAADGRTRRPCPGLLHSLLQAEDIGRPAPVSQRQRHSELAGGQHRLGDGVLWGEFRAIGRRLIHGRHASMALGSPPVTQGAFGQGDSPVMPELLGQIRAD